MDPVWRDAVDAQIRELKRRYPGVQTTLGISNVSFGLNAAARQVLTDFGPKLVLLLFLVAMGLYLPAPINTLFRQVAAGLGAQ